MSLQSKFIHFYQVIKFDRQKNKSQLIQRSNQLVSDVRNYLKKEHLPMLKEVYLQGSYGVDTGVKPTKGRDYDIDVALVFDINIKEYKDPTIVKQWVERAINHYSNGKAEMLSSCVRVNYKKYHVDLAVYGYSNQVKYIAKGQKGSQHNNKQWELSPSAKLKDKLNKPSLSGKERAQYRRLICYLKRWKDVNFKATTNEAPIGIALTVMVYLWFQPQFKKDQPNDLKALQVVLKQGRNNNYGLGTKLPVKPNNSLFEEINASSRHRENYIKRMKLLCQAVQTAHQDPTNPGSAQLLRIQFGEDFPR